MRKPVHYSVQNTQRFGLSIQDNDLSEFDESREIIESLVDEYKACESPDYIKWGMEDAGEANVAAALDSKLVV